MKKINKQVDTLKQRCQFCRTNFTTKILPFSFNHFLAHLQIGTRLFFLLGPNIVPLKSQKRNNIRRKIVPGNSKSLWKAVNEAYDNGASTLPDCMTLDGKVIGEHERSDCFVNFFENKVKQITDETIIDPSVYVCMYFI